MKKTMSYIDYRINTVKELTIELLKDKDNKSETHNTRMLIAMTELSVLNEIRLACEKENRNGK